MSAKLTRLQKARAFRADYLRQAQDWEDMAKGAPKEDKPALLAIARRLRAEAKRALTPHFQRVFCN